MIDVLLPDTPNAQAVTVRIYGDISGTEDSDVIVAAGYIGPKRDWKRVGRQWQDALPPGVVFHATDFYACRGDFDGWVQNGPEHIALISKLTAIPRERENHLLGFAFGIETKPFTSLLKPELERIDAPYRPTELRVFIVSLVLQRIAQFLLEKPRRPELQRRVIVFEYEDGFGKVIDYFHWCQKQREPWALAYEAFYTAPKKVPPLQVADLLAHEGWRRCSERIKENPRPVRKSWESMVLNGGIQLQMMTEKETRESVDSLRAFVNKNPDGLVRPHWKKAIPNAVNGAVGLLDG